MLVAMPTALVPAGTLPVDPSETDLVGLNTHMESLLPETEDQGLIGFGEDLDIIPDPSLLVELVQDWLSPPGRSWRGV